MTSITHPLASAAVTGAPVFLTMYTASTATIDLLDLASLKTISVDQKKKGTSEEDGGGVRTIA